MQSNLVMVMLVYNERSTLRLVLERVSFSPKGSKAKRNQAV